MRKLPQPRRENAPETNERSNVIPFTRSTAPVSDDIDENPEAADYPVEG